MSTPSTQTTDRTDHGRDAAGTQSRAKRAVSTARNRGRPGSTAMVAGGTLLARATRTFRRNRRRAAIQALIGGALVAIGLRRSRSASETASSDRTGSAGGSGGGETTMVDRARSAADRVGIGGGTDANPRGVSNEPDVETKTDPDEGRVQFRTDQDAGPRSKPHLDEDGADDPRRHEEEDEVDIDISEAALADEASEATGPDPEQAQPASTEGTEPEITPEEDPSHPQADETDASVDTGTDDAETTTEGSTDDDESAFVEDALDEDAGTEAVSDPDSEERDDADEDAA